MIVAVVSMMTENDDVLTEIIPEDDFFLMMTQEERRRGTPGRRCMLPRNDIVWFERYATRPCIRISPLWKALFCLAMQIFDEVLEMLREQLTCEDTTFRWMFDPNIRLATFLMYAGPATYKATASQLRITKSAFPIIVDEVSREIVKHYQMRLSFQHKYVQ